MKKGRPITKSILIADLPAGDKPLSCRPIMTAGRRLFQVYSDMLLLLNSLMESGLFLIKLDMPDRFNGFTALSIEIYNILVFCFAY